MDHMQSSLIFVPNLHLAVAFNGSFKLKADFLVPRVQTHKFTRSPLRQNIINYWISTHEITV
jgi:long-subunit fatty acid transport protein